MDIFQKHLVDYYERTKAWKKRLKTIGHLLLLVYLWFFDVRFEINQIVGEKFGVGALGTSALEIGVFAILLIAAVFLCEWFHENCMVVSHSEYWPPYVDCAVNPFLSLSVIALALNVLFEYFWGVGSLGIKITKGVAITMIVLFAITTILKFALEKAEDVRLKRKWEKENSNETIDQ